MKIQSAVKTETGKIALGTGIGVIIMYLVFFVLHKLFPTWAPFDYKVILGGIGGFIVAVGNFFWMAITVQKVANTEDEDKARSVMGVSYSCSGIQFGSGDCSAIYSQFIYKTTRYHFCGERRLKAKA